MDTKPSPNPNPDPHQADYPMDTVPNKVEQLFKALQFHERKGWEVGLTLTLTPTPTLTFTLTLTPTPTQP